MVLALAPVPAALVPGRQDTVADQLADARVLIAELSEVTTLLVGAEMREVPAKTSFLNLCRTTITPGVGMTMERQRRIALVLGVPPRTVQGWYRDFMFANPRYFQVGSRRLPRARQAKAVIEEMKKGTLKIPSRPAKKAKKMAAEARDNRKEYLTKGNGKITRSKRVRAGDLNNFEVANFIEMRAPNSRGTAFNGTMERHPR